MINQNLSTKLTLINNTYIRNGWLVYIITPTTYLPTYLPTYSHHVVYCIVNVYVLMCIYVYTVQYLGFIPRYIYAYMHACKAIYPTLDAPPPRYLHYTTLP